MSPEGVTEGSAQRRMRRRGESQKVMASSFVRSHTRGPCPGLCKTECLRTNSAATQRKQSTAIDSGSWLVCCSLIANAGLSGEA